MKQAIIVRTDLKMNKGKIAAQCAHASIEAFTKTSKQNLEWVKEWQTEGQKKVVLKVSSEKELIKLNQELKDEGLKTALIKDAGLTQIQAGSTTCLGVGPAPEERIDKITKHLKLL
ncbi:MAG: peptidyl-tRNA hydrolase Pth2 [archaeon]